MRRFLFLLFLLPTIAFGQDKKAVVFYPDGKPYWAGTGKTIGQLNKEFEEHGRVYSYDYVIDDDYENSTTVCFKLFTDIPLYIYGDTTKLQEAIKNFNLDEYFHSYDFETYLEISINEGTLSDLFILETLGQPNNKYKYYDKDFQIDRWTYSNIGVTLTFKSGIVTSYQKVE